MPSAARTCVSFANFSYIGKMRLEIAPRLHAAQVPVVTIGTNHVLPFAERRVVPVLAADERVLARPGRREEVPAPAPAHDSRLGRDLQRLEPAALEDLPVRLGVLAEALVEPRLVAVERIAVLHDELADADQPAPRARLVAVLRLEVVPDLRQLLVRLDFAPVEG